MKRLAKAVRRLYRRYPARCNTVIVAVVVGAFGLAGITVDAVTVKDIAALELPILIGGEVTHRKVSPTNRSRR